MSSTTDTLHLVLRPESPSEVLMYYDGPLLMWLDSVDGRRFLAIALSDDEGPWPFLLVELDADEQQALESNQMTLREACLGQGNKWLLADYGAQELEIELLQEVPQEWLPGDVYLVD